MGIKEKKYTRFKYVQKELKKGEMHLGIPYIEEMDNGKARLCANLSITGKSILLQKIVMHLYWLY